MPDFHHLSASYQQALLRQIVPFCLKNSRDESCGGYFDLLSATGQPIEGDKWVTAQARQAWAFARLYNTVDGRPDWLNHARHGGNFLRQFARTDAFDCFARLDRRGRLPEPALDSSPACAVVMACAQLHRATGETEWASVAQQIFGPLAQRRTAIRTQQNEVVAGGFRPLQHLGETALWLKATLEMRPLLGEEPLKAAVDAALHEIMHEFLDRRTDTLREFVLPGGSFVNTPEGRRLHVGLTCQTVSCLLDLCAETGNRKMAAQVVGWCLRLCERAWDETTGGLNQYVDLKNEPSVFSGARQKWAWVQAEAALGLIKGYVQTRHPDCLAWFKRIQEYLFKHFPDPAHLAWHLAVDPHRQPLFSAKAIPEAGCFSLVSCFAETAQLLTACAALPPPGRPLRPY